MRCRFHVLNINLFRLPILHRANFTENFTKAKSHCFCTGNLLLLNLRNLAIREKKSQFQSLFNARNLQHMQEIGNFGAFLIYWAKSSLVGPFAASPSKSLTNQIK